MAVVNQYKFYGVDDSTSGLALTMFGASLPAVSETYIVKSLKVTSAGTPTVTVMNDSVTNIKTAALSANQTSELLTMPLIVVGGTNLTIKSSSADSFDVAISYLNIKKEVTT